MPVSLMVNRSNMRRSLSHTDAMSKWQSGGAALRGIQTPHLTYGTGGNCAHLVSNVGR